jgi:hypothetical protein
MFADKIDINMARPQGSCLTKINDLIWEVTMKQLLTLIILVMILTYVSLFGQQIEYVSSTLYDGSLNSIKVTADGYAYCLTNDVLETYSISNPTSPNLLNSFPMRTYIHDIALSGVYGYIAADNGLYIVNLSDPLAPRLEYHFQDVGAVNNIEIDGQYGYVLSDTELFILNLSNPVAPSISGSYILPQSAMDICVHGGYAYIADGSSGLQILSIANPANPIAISNIPTQWQTQRVVVDGSYAYFSDFYENAPSITSALRIFDISSPSAPAPVTGLQIGRAHV